MRARVEKVDVLGWNKSNVKQNITISVLKSMKVLGGVTSFGTRQDWIYLCNYPHFGSLFLKKCAQISRTGISLILECTSITLLHLRKCQSTVEKPQIQFRIELSHQW